MVPEAGKRIDVLVVDDDPIVRFLTVEVLRASGWTVDAAPDGLTALDQLSNSSVRAIILDIRMPGLNGLGFLDSVKEPPPVVVLTGGSWDDEIATRSAKVFAHVRKPIEPSALIGLIGEALAESPMDPICA